MKFDRKIYSLIDRTKGWQLLVFALAMTIFFALGYFILSVFTKHGIIVSDSKNATISFWDALYFSIVTEATLGYGDILPIGISRLLACLQVFIGLIWAGLTVAKITSINSTRLRSVSSHAEGYWMEPFKIKDNPTLFTFSQIFYDGEDLRYDGDNYNYHGEYEGSFRSQLISCEGNYVKFEYKNIDQTHLFDTGIMDVTFYNLNSENKWTVHKAICHDHGKTEKTPYEGYRASENEIRIMKGKNQNERAKLIKEIIDEFNLKPN